MSCGFRSGATAEWPSRRSLLKVCARSSLAFVRSYTWTDLRPGFVVGRGRRLLPLIVAVTVMDILYPHCVICGDKLMLAVLVNDSSQRISVHFILRKGTMRRVLPVKSTAVSRVITWRSQYSCAVPTPERQTLSRNNYSKAGSVSPSPGLPRHHIPPRLIGIFAIAKREVYSHHESGLKPPG